MEELISDVNIDELLDVDRVEIEGLCFLFLV